MKNPLTKLEHPYPVFAFTEYVIHSKLKLIDLFKRADLEPLLKNSNHLFRVEHDLLIIRIFHSHDKILNNKFNS